MNNKTKPSRPSFFPKPNPLAQFRAQMGREPATDTEMMQLFGGSGAPEPENRATFQRVRGWPSKRGRTPPVSE